VTSNTADPASGVATRPDSHALLRDTWGLRNAAAETLVRTELQARRQLESATVDELVELLDSFSPARSPSPEWTRSFEALVERLWAWCDAAQLSALEAEFRGRGSAWSPVANALTPTHGERVKAQLRSGFASARLPLFTLA
jgi:hypothetical protein